MDYRDYVEANRNLWNKTARIHARVYVDQLFERIKSPDFRTFDEVEEKLFEILGLEGKAVAQLACNNGRELISVKKAGAGRCVGFDISDEFIDQARRLAEAGDVDVEFVRSDVYELPPEFHTHFDLVYITVGALGWLPDLAAFFDVISQLLKPGGQLFIYEMHPILNMYEAEKGLEVVSSYFRTEPLFEEQGTDYFDPSQVVEGASYWFPYKVSDVISGCLDHGLDLKHFREYDHDISMVYAAFEKLENRPPLSYSLIARKTP